MESTFRDPYVLVDEISSVEYYIGTSLSSNTNGKSWKIKKIWKDGTIWKTGYPDGDQNFAFIWNNKNDYNYV